MSQVNSFLINRHYWRIFGYNRLNCVIKNQTLGWILFNLNGFEKIINLVIVTGVHSRRETIAMKKPPETEIRIRWLRTSCYARLNIPLSSSLFIGCTFENCDFGVDADLFEVFRYGHHDLVIRVKAHTHKL